MKDLIAPELFQNSTCTLPGIGTLSVITHPAETAFISGQIKAPVPEIVFYPSVEEKVFNEFTAVSMLLKNELEEKGEIILSGIGSFTKDEVDNIQFIPDRVPAAFTPFVAAQRVIRQDVEHAILVGDKETNSTVMTDYFNAAPSKRDYWWVIAATLFLIAAGVFIFYYLQNGVNGLGNTVHLEQ